MDLVGYGAALQKEGNMYRHVAVIVGLMLAMCSAVVLAEDIQNIVFYDTFESGDTSGWWAPARVGATGLKTCYGISGQPIDCAGTGQDGDLQPGVAWPEPRFVHNADGTVTDMLTGLVWLKDASCSELEGTLTDGRGSWVVALTASASLSAGTCGLIDGSAAGDWRLPSINELRSLIDYRYIDPALSNSAGTAHWSEGNPFSDVQLDHDYWSSTTSTGGPCTNAWHMVTYHGVLFYSDKGTPLYIWPVRNGL